MDSLNTNLSNITREHTNSGNQLYEVIGIMEEKFKGVLDNFVKKSQRVLDAVAQAQAIRMGCQGRKIALLRQKRPLLSPSRLRPLR